MRVTAAVEAIRPKRPLRVLAASIAAFVASAFATALFLPSLEAMFAIAFLAIVFTIVWSDFSNYIIPDWACFALASFGLLRAWLIPDIIDGASRNISLAEAAVNGMLALLVMWLIHAAYRNWRGHDGLGLGDVKLAGACAIWLDPFEQSMTLEIAALAGIALLLWRQRASGFTKHGWRRAIPFGALLAPAAFIMHIAGPFIELGFIR